MPIYEYRCSTCGHTLESLQKFSDAPLVECPHCHQHDLVKLVSLVGFKLKGSGWYVTDFRNIGAKPAAKSGDATAGNPENGAKDRPEADGNGSRSNAEQPAAASGSEGATTGSDATGKAESTSSGPKHDADSGTSTGSASATSSGSGSGSDSSG